MNVEVEWIFRNRHGLPGEIAAHNLAVTCARYRGDYANAYRCLPAEMDADPRIQAEIAAIGREAA